MNSSITVEAVDREIAQWDQDLSAASANLYALTDLDAYKELSDPKNKLTGETARQVTPHLNAMTELWQFYSLLKDPIERARAIRQALPKIIGKAEKLNEISELLNGESITLPAVDVSLQHRGLLTRASTSRKITPRDLLQDLIASYEQVKQMVLKVDEALKRLMPIITAAFDEASALKEQAKRLGESVPALDQVNQSLWNVYCQIKSNPLEASADTSSVTNSLPAIRIYLNEVRAYKEQMPARMGEADALIAAVEKLFAQAADGYSECAYKVQLPVPCALPDAQRIAVAKRRLAIYKAKYREGDWRSVMNALKRWVSECQSLKADCERCISTNTGLLERRKNAQGRLDASKARAGNHNLSENTELQAISQQLEPMLFSHGDPSYAGCNLNQVEPLVDRYENLVRSLIMQKVSQ